MWGHTPPNERRYTTYSRKHFLFLYSGGFFRGFRFCHVFYGGRASARHCFYTGAKDVASNFLDRGAKNAASWGDVRFSNAL